MSGTNRRKVWQITALFAALLVLPLFSATAHADRLSLGAIFRIGGVHFNLAFGDFGYGHPRGYYYRTADPISYGNYRCNSYCFTSGGYHYHSDSCPLVRHHLAYFEIDPLSLYDRYAPGYGSGYGYNYGYGYNNYGNGYSNRYDGYTRYDRRGGYNRYDNRHDNQHDRRYDNRYDRYPYPDRRHDRDRDRNDGRHDRDRHDGRQDRDRRDDRHDRHDDRHHGGHSSSGRPQHH
ncbi:MAG TPA: hypothetical protein VGS22_06490 [Thermoanaerobaculia bacterium]|jgi:hypothetical protein|nr:hypothetical protein [Thermoanaerobaculia bacterium]